VRLLEYLSHRPKKGYNETRRVLNANNEVVVESVDVLKRPVLIRTTELFDSGVVVGRIEISRSLLPLIRETGLLLFFMLPLGAGVLVVLRLLPIRAIRRSESALTKERDAARKYLDVAGVMLVAIDTSQRVTMINRKGCEIMGYAEQQILHTNWFDNFIPERNREKTRETYAHLNENGLEHFAFVESQVLTKSGAERLIAWHNIILTNDEGEYAGILGSGEDVTDRKHLEAQLRHAQKMEAVGLLAGGIAHDFNNILTAIIGYASLLQMKVNKDDPMLHNVEQIIDSSNRAAHLVKRLLAFSRKQIIDPRPVRVNDIVRGVEKLLSKLLREDIEMRTALSEDDMTIRVDSGQIEQILMNLAANARDAMLEGGLFSIETGSVKLDHEFIRAHGYGVAGAYARISVSDTGMGMTAETKEKVFIPFFTTKEVGKGTGLGLAMAYGIMKQHHGFINVYSEPGIGTTFKLYFPLIKAEAVQERRKADELLLPAKGAETVLVAEDDATVRTMTKSVLQSAGYTVIEARDGEEAVKEFTEHNKTVDLVIIDVIMPKKNGRVVFDEIEKIRPDIKALFTSGYTADILREQMILGFDTHFLSKPVSPALLLKKVRETLDA
jgi:PAS domain S-box-containing protein